MFKHYFIYIDESGGTLNEPDHPFFVLAAVVARVDQCRPIQEKVAKIKEGYFPGIRPEEIEIKGFDIQQGEKFFKHIAFETRQRLVKELLQLLFEYDLSIFATIFSKEEESVRRLKMHPDDPYRFSYKNLLERLNKFLESKNEYGILLIDSQASSVREHLKDDRLLRFHQECLSELTPKGTETRIVEYPIFVQSQFFAATQLADLCAYHIARALKNRYSQSYSQKLHAGTARFMPPIDHRDFHRDKFLDDLFSSDPLSKETLNFPIILKRLKLSGGIEKLP
jgi:hypothetical protein